jgi:hypothetical protein
VVKDNHLLRATAKITDLMVSKLCPLVLLVKISWTQGGSFLELRRQADHCWSVHHRQEVVLWAGLFRLNVNFLLYLTENSVLVHYTEVPGNVCACNGYSLRESHKTHSCTV